MREKINSILLDCWSSLINGIDSNKAAVKLEDYVTEELGRFNTLHKLEKLNLERDLDSFELDLEISTKFLERVLPEIIRLKEINSNNPNKFQELSELIYRIEEQIIENGK